MGTISNTHVKKLTIIIALVFLPLCIFAQVQTRQIKMEDLSTFFTKHTEFDANEINLSGVDVNNALAEDIIDDSLGLPPRFGIAMDVDYDLKNAGSWKDVYNGRIWKLKINSSNAKSLNLIFDRFYIPNGGELYI
jgi:lysyl endopeptidase